MLSLQTVDSPVCGQRTHLALGRGLGITCPRPRQQWAWLLLVMGLEVAPGTKPILPFQL